MAKTKQSLFQNLNYKRAFEYYQGEKGARYSWWTRILIFFGTIIVCSVFFVLHVNIKDDISGEYSIVPGHSWPNQTLVADFTYPIFRNKDSVSIDKEKARNRALPVFVTDERAIEKTQNLLGVMIRNLKDSYSDSNDVTTIFFTEDALLKLQDLNPQAYERELKNIERIINNFLNNIVYKYGFINVSSESLTEAEIDVRKMPNIEMLIKAGNLTDSSIYLEQANIYLSNKLSENSRIIALEITSKLMLPNLIYSEKLSEKYKTFAEESIPMTDGIVTQGTVIVKKGEKVTEETMRKIESYLYSKNLKSDIYFSFWSLLGGFGHAALIFSILLLYLFFIRRRIFTDNSQLMILSAILALVCMLSWLSIIIPTKLPIEYLVFIPALSMLTAIVFDSRTAFYVTVTMALMLAAIRGNDYDTSTAMLIAGTLAAYTVRDIQSRTQIFQSMFYIFIGFIVSITAISLERSTDLIPMLYKYIMAASSAVLSPMLTFGLLFLLERFTSITTDLRLQEYDKLNHPLLIKLSELAPGTYQHTLSLAMLAERCSREINANPLLTKIGAYFHDIGKVSKPEYFAENQIDFENKHDKISPRKSVEAIKSHVHEGIKLAEEYKIPQKVIDMIPMHHGTSLIKHFYAKALEEAGSSSIIQDDFRYPGPKPNSKEAAIIMICDSAEAISRLSGQDKESLEKAVDSIIRDKILDGQLEECDISLKEIQIVKETCIKNLTGASHQRVQYKEIPKDKH